MSFKKTLIYFLGWRLYLFFIAFFSSLFIQHFGNRFPYKEKVLEITNLPAWVWGFGNFDGVHYLRIAQNGYTAQFSQAFFPLFPLLIHFFTYLLKPLFGASNLDTSIYTDPIYFYTGILLSNIFFLIAIYFFYKLIKIDYTEFVSFNSVILLLTLPTAFYFGSIYTESLFFLLSVLAFYFMRKQNFLAAGAFSFLACFTRFLGIVLVVCLVVELITYFRTKGVSKNYLSIVKNFFGVLIAPLGLIIYMIYLKIDFNNSLYFLTAQPFFGAERGNSIVLLPQVFFRYLKILTSVSLKSFAFFNAFLEFTLTVGSLIFTLFSFKKIRLSYFIFSISCLMIPTLTGTLSSMPRYALMIFLILPFLVQFSRKYLIYLYSILIILQIILLSLFIRGYWVA